MDSLSLVKLLEKEKFDSDDFLFTVDFASLYTNIPVKHAIEFMKEIVFEYKDVISNAEFIIDLLEIVLEHSLMEFNGEYFQQIEAGESIQLYPATMGLPTIGFFSIFQII